MLKTVLFIPGFYEGLTDRAYRSVLDVFEAEGYKTVFVSINWRYTNLNHWLRQLNAVYAKYDSSQIILAGFSFGAVTAFVAAAVRNPNSLFLCSMSPYFNGDKPRAEWLKFIGKRRAKAFKSLDFAALAKQINCPTHILYGENESDQIKYRAKETSRLIKNSILTVVPAAKHDIAAKEYIQAIGEKLA